MAEIKCPKCGHVFSVSESDYNEIVKQVKDNEFNKQIEIVKKQLELKHQNDLLCAKQDSKDSINKLGLSIKDLENKLALANAENAKLVAQAVADKEKRITELESQIKLDKQQASIDVNNIREQYDAKLKDKDKEIDYYKNLKISLSTKEIGESLEQYCLNKFNEHRMTLFANSGTSVTFEKDNTISDDSRSKGDFIFKELTSEGAEIISIMFEMKNESPSSTYHKKNSDFFKELDKDRKEKGCEYAVLVTLLEPENDFYNSGIVDVSYEYPKMFVVRPQNFMAIIGLLRNAAFKNIEIKNALKKERDTNLDITHFEENLESFKEGFSKNYDAASKKFSAAIDEIEKTIAHLQKVKDALLSSDNQLRLANNKAQELTIRKLTYKNPTMKAKFDEIRNAKEEDE